MRYRISSDDIYDVQDDTSLIIENEEGDLLTSAVGATYVYDRRNSVVDPTAGFILTLNQEFAGLGGDTRYSKTQARARAYTSFFEEELVLSAELEGGLIVSQDGTRITDRFNTGGDSFRGFARNGLGPRDFCGGGDEAACAGSAGGSPRSTTRSAATTTACSASTRASRSACPSEYGVYGGLFADVGSLWQLDDTDGSMGEVDAELPPALLGRRQPVRRHSDRAAPVQLRGAAAIRGLRRARAVPVLGPDPVLMAAGRSAPRRLAAALALALAAAGPSRPRPRPRSWPRRPTPPAFCSSTRSASSPARRPARRSSPRRSGSATRCAPRHARWTSPSRRRRASSPSSARRCAPEEFRKLSDAFDARVVQARRDQDQRANDARPGI